MSVHTSASWPLKYGTGVHSGTPASFQYLAQSGINRLCKINHFLIQSFRRSILDIKENLTGTYLFLLTDVNGVLLSMDYSSNLEPHVKQSPIRPGLSFSAQSCGVNAISRTMEDNAPVFLLPEQHESPFFQSWHCYAVPLYMGSQHFGYLDVSTINADMQRELMAIAKLIPANMQNRYQSQSMAHQEKQLQVEFTERQLTILEMIPRMDCKGDCIAT